MSRGFNLKEKVRAELHEVCKYLEVANRCRAKYNPSKRATRITAPRMGEHVTYCSATNDGQVYPCSQFRRTIGNSEVLAEKRISEICPARILADRFSTTPESQGLENKTNSFQVTHPKP